MVPNRGIKESCRTSHTLDQISDFSERFFWRLITVADDFGLFPADPRFLLAECFPLKVETMKVSKISTAYAELEKVGLVLTYSKGDRKYGKFTTWEDHNRKRAKNPKYPLPTSDNICKQMTAIVAETRDKRQVQETRDKPTLKGLGRVSKCDHTFDEFWEIWPYKIAKRDAEKAWNEVVKANEMPALVALTSTISWQESNGCLQPNTSSQGRDTRPYPATWLRGRRFNDEYPVDSGPGHFDTEEWVRKNMADMEGKTDETPS